MSWAVRLLLHKMRIWDARSANGVDAFVANSQYIARRIEKTYRREATVIYPPVDLDFYSPASVAREDFYLAASRMVPYKRMPLIIDAFNAMPDRKLIVVGDGPDFSIAKSIAKGNVTLVGSVSAPQLRDYMRRARAFVFAAEEDFGITLLEAQACGTAVIAYRKGGASETVIPAGQSSEPTGILFEEQRVESLMAAVERFERLAQRIDPADCIANASRFSAARFREEFSAFIDAQIESRFHSTPKLNGLRLTAL
jgi:glycosyltransferase involved in cell wall biosynthesis